MGENPTTNAELRTITIPWAKLDLYRQDGFVETFRRIKTLQRQMGLDMTLPFRSWLDSNGWHSQNYLPPTENMEMGE